MTSSESGLRPSSGRLPGSSATRAVALAAAVHRARDRLLGVRHRNDTVAPVTRAYLLFALTPLLYVVQQLLTNSRFVLGGEMYAEMATNYYATTQDVSPALQLLAIDAGYIPLPQRLIGLAGLWLGLAPSAIPYFYTGAALVASGLLVGVICLPIFRSIVGSDFLRFGSGIAILLLPDFETRLFLNFTYLVVVPAALLAALALTGREVPRWSWLLPVLLLSKPAVLAALPVVLAAALVSTRRFRCVAAASLVAGLVQVVRLSISSTIPGSLQQSQPGESLLEKVLVAAEYTLGFAGRFVVTLTNGSHRSANILAGGMVLLVFLAAVLTARSRAGALVLAGLSLLPTSMLLNAVVYPNWFNSDLSLLNMPIFDRRVVVALIGVFLAMAGFIAMVTQSPTVRLGNLRLLHRCGPAAARVNAALMQGLRSIGVVFFIAWFGIAGWGPYVRSINTTPSAPMTDVSEWQTTAPALVTNHPVVCIPVAPYGWPTFGRNCTTLAGFRPLTVDFRSVPQQQNKPPILNLTVPAEVRSRVLSAVEILVRPQDVDGQVDATLTMTGTSGSTHMYRASKSLPLTGGALIFQGSPADRFGRPESVSISFSRPVEVGWATPDGASTESVAVQWMGQ